MAYRTQPKSSDEPQTSRDRPKAPQRNEEANSSVETILHRPPTHTENLPPHLPSTIRGLPAGIHQVIGFPLRDTHRDSFNQAITQEANWPLPDSIVQGLKYQHNRYAPPQPRIYNSTVQSAQANRIFDPDDGTIYSHCSECDPSGGPTDCQHPADPPYSTNLNPLPDDHPAFEFRKRIQWPPVTPKKASPVARFITKPSPSKVAVIKEHVSPYSPSLDDQSPLLGSPTANRRGILRAQADLPVRSGPFPDEMLAARHLSNFLTENVEEGIVTSYVYVSCSMPLLILQLPLPFTRL